MAKFGIPGFQAAVSRQGRVIYERGVGYADLNCGAQVETDSLFRIASLSKPITAVAILKLIERRVLRLDDRVTELLADFIAGPTYVQDKRWHKITVRHLLEHRGGFDRSLQGDQQFIWYEKAADAFDEERPANAKAIVRYAMTQPLAFEPGCKSVYSNLGYNILGRVIEQISGTDYQSFVQKEIGTPAAIGTMTIGKTRASERHEREAAYYEMPCTFSSQGVPRATQATGRSLFPGDPPEVEIPYGASFVIESMDAHGGWLLSASDMVRFVCAIEGYGGSARLLGEEAVREMTHAPAGDVDLESYYAKGWRIISGGEIWTHNGALVSSTGALATRMAHGCALALVCNHLPTDMHWFFDRELHDLASLLPL